MNKSKIVLFTASLALAMAFTLSCSSDDGDGNEDGLSSGGTEISSSSADNDGNSSSSEVTESSSSADNICGSETYNPETEFCSENIIFELCGSETYNPETEFCSENIVYELCNGDEYNPTEEYCSVGTIKEYGSVTDNEGQTYKTVEIGTQTWMAENLNYETASGSWCYDDNADYCTTYGRLYDWATAMSGATSSTANPSGVQGVCPNDWHLPSRAEWETLMTAVGGASTAGTKLKSATSWDGTDDYGFSALPGGSRRADGSFNHVGTYSYWWSATEVSGTGTAFYWYMGSTIADAYNNNNNKSGGVYVRCLKD